jgi:hypothetical protein
MIGLRFPEIDVPEGWTAATRGPRRWVVPPDATMGRIVLLPIIPRKKNLDPQLGPGRRQGASEASREVLEASIAAEMQRYAAVKQTPFAPIAARDGLSGVSTEVALLVEGDALLERRAYAALADERAVYTLFLQALPAAYPALLPVFRAAAETVRTAR